MKDKKELIEIIIKGEFDEKNREVKAALEQLQRLNERKRRCDTRRFYRVNGKPEKKATLQSNIIF